VLTSLSPTRNETRSEAIQGRARFQQHRDASCHQVLSFLQGKAPKEIQAILKETLACLLPGRSKDLSALLYVKLCLDRQFTFLFVYLLPHITIKRHINPVQALHPSS